ncbi:TRAP transporter small permease [Chloroflexota bacterium]
MSRFSKIISVISFVCGITAVTILAVMVFISVVMRYLFNAPLFFVDEIATYLVMAIGFLGFAYTMKAGGHIRVEVILNRLPATAQRGVQTIDFIFLFLFAMILLFGSIILTLGYYKVGTLAATVLETPLFIPAICMIIGSALLFIEIIIQIYSRRK